MNYTFIKNRLFRKMYLNLLPGCSVGGGYGVRCVARFVDASPSGKGPRRRRRRQEESSCFHTEGPRREDARLHRLRVHLARPQTKDTCARGENSVRVRKISRRRCFFSTCIGFILFYMYLVS